MKAFKVIKNSFCLSILTCVGMTAFGSVAEAASVINRWDVTTADAGAYGGGGGHAFWFAGMGKGDARQESNAGLSREERANTEAWLDRVGTRRFVFQDAGRLEEFDDGTARLTGRIVDKRDRNPNTENFWDVNVWFDKNFVRSQGAKAKNEINRAGDAAVKDLYGIGTNGKSDMEGFSWRYYSIKETDDVGNPLSVLTGNGIYEDFELRMRDGRGAHRGYETQIGYGASGKNIDMGMSSWFSYDVFKTAEDAPDQWIASQKVADINVDLIAVPEPASLIGLGLVGLGMYVRRKSQTTEDV
ncbi:MAG: PEP-CTERM sorting domain-containing protein [Merismopedia sp. SIO2A8]|nr:PEP-CTERM sorting domain-containing protein [Merismopedia sp. SIO2A8]